MLSWFREHVAVISWLTGVFGTLVGLMWRRFSHVDQELDEIRLSIEKIRGEMTTRTAMRDHAERMEVEHAEIRKQVIVELAKLENRIQIIAKDAETGRLKVYDKIDAAIEGISKEIRALYQQLLEAERSSKK